MINDENVSMTFIFDREKEKDGYSGIPIGVARKGFIEVIEQIYGYNKASTRTYNCLCGEYINQELYDNFFEKLKEKFEYAIITTNYDLICETSLEYLIGCKPLLFPVITDDYKLGGTYIAAPLLKLHGSIDWKETRARADLPNIVPPTFVKQFRRGDKFIRIWKEAQKAIKCSDTIIFIGYSLPKIDTHVRYLIKTGLQTSQHNHRKKNVYVVNKSWTYEDEENYDFIKKSKIVRDLIPLQMRFKEFANSDISSLIE